MPNLRGRAAVTVLLFFAIAHEAFPQSIPSSPSPLVELTNRARKIVLCELVNETDREMTVVRIATGRRHTVLKESLVKIRREVSNEEAIQIVGLPGFTAWRITRAVRDRPDPIRVAVLPPVDSNGTVTPAGERLAESLSAEIAKRGTSIAERTALARTLEQLGGGRTVDDAIARELGRQLEVFAVVTGTMSESRFRRETRLRLIAVESGRTLANVRHAIQTGGIATSVSSRSGQRFTISEQALGVVFSPDGSTIATSGVNGSVKLWKTSGGELRYAFRGHRHRAHNITFSPDGRRLAAASFDGTVRVWDLGSLREMMSVQAHPRNARAVAFLPDGESLLTAGDDSLIKVWNVSDSSERQVLEGHDNFVRCLTVSRDGQLLVSGSNDRTIKLWDTRSGTVVGTLNGHKGYVYCVALSPDRNTLASSSSDGTAIIWNLRRRTVVGRISPSAGPMTCLGFSPDGGFLATGHANETVKLWRVNTQEQIATIDKDDGPIGWLAFSPDGLLLAACADAQVSVWNFPELVR